MGKGGPRWATMDNNGPQWTITCHNNMSWYIIVDLVGSQYILCTLSYVVLKSESAYFQYFFMGVSYIYLLLTSRKGITNIKKRVTNIKERVTGDATYISGKHWQQTLANASNGNVCGHNWNWGNIGERTDKG